MKFFNSKNWELIKYAIGMASKIFLALTLIDVASSFFEGTFDTTQIEIISNILTILFCVATVFIIEHMKVKMWLRILVSYGILLVVVNGFVLGVGLLQGGFPYLESFVNNTITVTIIFAITASISFAAEHVQTKANKKAEDENAE